MEGRTKTTLIALLCVLSVLLVIGLIITVVLLTREKHPVSGEEMADPSVPGTGEYWWDSGYGRYRYAAVAAEETVCSQIDTDILARLGGSSVDAAIAAKFCLGVMNPVMTGVGGGSFITVYDRRKNGPEREAWVINCRETAPSGATQDMYTGDGAPSSTRGGMSIAVPGEVAGHYEAWKVFGRVPWARLVEPAIKLARDGFSVPKYLARILELEKEKIEKESELRGTFMRNGSPLKEGEKAYRPKLAVTLQKITDNPMSFYDPSDQLAQDIVADVQDRDGKVSLNDLRMYKASVTQPIRIPFDNGRFTLLTPQPPSSGVIVGNIVKVLSGFKFDNTSLESVDKAIQTYQRIVESFKLAYAQRSKLGDSEFVNNTQAINDLLSDEMVEKMRTKINESFTQPIEYLLPAYLHGFGSMVMGQRMGIMFNDEMDDFGKPGSADYFGIPPAPNNFIVPGKRPMSSMSPSIVLNDKGEVVLVTGSSGGTRIITVIVLSIFKSLWMDWDAKHSVDDPRLHHQLVPNKIVYQPSFSKPVLNGLGSKGHDLEPRSEPLYLSTNQLIRNTCGLCSTDDTKCFANCRIEAVSDGRRFGRPDGY